MIRWQTRSETYRFTDSYVNTTEKNKTEVALCIPLWGKTGTTDHFCDGEQTRITGGLRNRISDGAFSGPQGRGFSTTLTGSIEIERENGELPLIALSAGAQEVVRTGAVSEGILTGATNATTGALLGFGACFFFGPAGGALTWSLIGGGATAVVTGVAQGCEVSKSNGVREFAERCNEFLLNARDTGLTPANTNRLRERVLEADTQQKRQLVREIIQVCQVVYGVQQTAALRALLPLMKQDAGGPPPYQADQ